MAGPLSHIRVLDLSRIVAGPWSSQILADLGADVIKVERPGIGDDSRSWGPPYLKDKDGRVTAEAGYFLSVNRGKRSLTLDLGTDEGQAIVKALAARSDILLENYKVGTLAKFGLDYASLNKINPRLIYASITGFGQDGPKAQSPAYDFMIQAMGGLMSVTGESDDVPGVGPQKVGVPIVDLMTGMYATVAVLAALARRGESGRGDYIDLALLDVQAAFLANQAMNTLITGEDSQRRGNRHANIQPQDVVPCRQGHLALAVGNDAQFAQFARVIGRPELPDDPRFARNQDRSRHQVELYAIIRPIMLERDATDWAARLDAVGVPAAPINSILAALAEPQLAHRQMVRQLPHPLSGTVPQVVSPMRFADAGLEFDRPPPLLGQHNGEVLGELGFSPGQIADLKARKII